MDVERIISKLGGVDTLATLTGVGGEAIRKWRQARAIPAKHWSALLSQPSVRLNDLCPEMVPESGSDTASRPGGATAVLVLQDGSIFWGYGFGAHTAKPMCGELCFSTGMTGYQETLTDPSFAGQLVTFTFPHIGNVGANEQDDEATRVAARGVIVKEDITEPANWRALETFDSWMKRQGLSGISAIDTRLITMRLRDSGPQNAILSYPENAEFNLPVLTAQARAWPGLEGMDLAKEVSCRQAYRWTQGLWPSYRASAGRKRRVVAIDYGAKQNILRCLVEAGCDVVVVPATASEAEILSHAPEGIFLSNGPGDPSATAVYAVPVIRALLERRIPLFGICLGHQLLALALGARTYKLERGHRGANQPVKDVTTQKVEITSQNHGFAVDEASLPQDVVITHISLFDNSNEGIASTRFPAFSVQYHPEASPGPSDSFYLFKRFVTLMDMKAA